jgi:hypothetical protein
MGMAASNLTSSMNLAVTERRKCFVMVVVVVGPLLVLK